MLTKRDMDVIDFVERFGVVTRDHIISRFFHNKQNHVVCNRRMAQIVKANKVKRAFNVDYWQSMYYTGKKPERCEHRLRIVDVYLWLQQNLKSTSDMDFTPEFKITYAKEGILRADGLVVLRRQKDGLGRAYFIEVDMGSERESKFDKYDGYRSLYLSNGWVHEPWAKLDGSGEPVFPYVVVIAYDERRMNALQKAIDTADAKVNDHKIKMKVVLWDEMKQQSSLSYVFSKKKTP